MPCQVLLGTAGYILGMRVLCVLPGTAGTVGYRRVYTSYCRFCVSCRELLGTAGYILGTVSSVCTAGYCWVLQVLCALPGTAGYSRVYTGYCGFCVFCLVLLVLWGTAGYILATAGSVCPAGYCWVLQGIYWVL